MNKNAANALLKHLEEPPLGAVMILVSDSYGAILPTIRSRCQKLHMRGLDFADAMRILLTLLPDVEAENLQALARLCEGAIADAIQMHNAQGLRLYKNIQTLFSCDAETDRQNLMTEVIDNYTKGDGAQSFMLFHRLLLRWLRMITLFAARIEMVPAVYADDALIAKEVAKRASCQTWIGLREKIDESLRECQLPMQLDKRHNLRLIFDDIDDIVMHNA
ncbi:MAG: hypothetical protein AAF352_04115, partial [Pseudomonadota bacterium]